MMMAVEPDLVDTGGLNSLAQERGDGMLRAGKGAYRWRPMHHLTANGVLGDPAGATVDQGEQLLEVAADGIAALITDPATWAPIGDERGEGTGGVPFRQA